MDRKPMIVSLLLTGCMQFQPAAPLFEVPQAAAVLQPEIGGPFEEPVGFVANSIGGQIVLLALKQGRPLTDDPTASFLPANQIATGDRRVLSSVAVYAPTDNRRQVTVFAGDRAFGELIAAPYIVDCVGEFDRYADLCENAPPGPVEGTRAFFRPFDVPGNARVRAGVKDGWTTTEIFTFTKVDEGSWFAEGSRSGTQPDLVVPGVLWSAEDRRLQILIEDEGETVVGDTFTVETGNRLTTIDAGGAPLALTLAPDQSWLAVLIQDRTTDLPRLRWLDPATLTFGPDVGLPAGAEPHRLAVSEGGGLLVADRARSAFYEVPWGSPDAVDYPLPWPSFDVAGLRVEGEDQRFVVPIDAGSVWRYDPATQSLLDVNPAQSGDQGITFTAPVRGIEAMPLPYRAPELDDDLTRVELRSVAVSLADGRVVFVNERSGCLVQTPEGPRTNITTQTGTTGIDVDLLDIPQSANFLSRFDPPRSGASNVVVVNDCAGIARAETWAVLFDQTQGNWEVEGSLSGVQERRVIEDERYVSDDGSVSFMLRSGPTPSVDGWRFDFNVLSGVAAATGDANLDGNIDVNVAVSGDPTFFFYRVGKPGPVVDPSIEGNQDIRPFVLVTGGATNRVGRVDPADDRSPVVEVGWQ